jgi:hypothetical protein
MPVCREGIAETCAKQQIKPGRLTLHADRGPSMTSKPIALLLADLGVTKSHSRPYVSYDNPFSEAQFKTLEYRPDLPQRFGGIADARTHCQVFFTWYNTEYRHRGIALMVPQDVYDGRTDQVLKTGSAAPDAAFVANPAHFEGNRPTLRTFPRRSGPIRQSNVGRWRRASQGALISAASRWCLQDIDMLGTRILRHWLNRKSQRKAHK